MTVRRILFMMVVLLAILVLAAPTAAQQDGPARVGLRPDAPEYALHGPYWVGVREFVIDDDGERPLPLTMWYPAMNPDGEPQDATIVLSYPRVPSLTYHTHALRDAVPDATSAPYPLVVYSHEFGNPRLDFLTLTEHLASYGFVVLAADHFGSTPNAAIPSLDPSAYRPREVSRLIDFAERVSNGNGELAGLIDANAIAVTGRLFGGWAALLTAGAQWDFEWFEEFCDAHPESWQRRPGDICGLINARYSLARMLELETTPQDLWPSQGDARVDAVVPLAPYSAESMFGPRGLAAITVPVLLIAGNAQFPNPVLSPTPHTELAYRELPGHNAVQAYEYLTTSQKGLVVFEQGTDLIFGDDWSRTASEVWEMFSNLFTEPVAYVLLADPVWDMDRAHDLINHFTTAFLLDVLKGDEAAHAALAPENVSFPGITYEAEGF